SEIQGFVSDTHDPIEFDRVLATVLFTDIVDSTRQATQMGDTQWRHLVDAHFSMARHQIRRHRGHEVKSLGDGILATFDGPGRAVRCAKAISESMKPLGISIRAGLHTGEVELRDDQDISGIAVSIASRISHLAKGGEVLVSSTVKDLVAGSGLAFMNLGEQSLKGLEGPLQIFRVT
ncbi:MAG: adenylate/guanylate cyclase domain-containing protein, partial [Phenylobacterium sp.]|nr:adenylate/guanylate cyclase domain-containing protein [Phenylobacterium sp.]